MAAATLTLRQLNRATLARQMLLARERIKPAAAIERLAGLQAQLARPPFIGLWSRLDGFRREDLTRLVERREVVRATMMRGTLHLVTAKDYLALRSAIQPVLDRGLRSVLKKRLDALDVAALVLAARELLDEAPRTFDALRDHFASSSPKGDIRAMGFAIRCTLPLVQVPSDTEWGYPGAASFAVAESWLGKPIGGDAGPAGLVLRYLAAFGPATPADAQTWSGLQGLRETFEALRPKLVTFAGPRGRELFDLPKAPRPSEDTPAPVRFLPEFDNLILAHADRSRLLADEHRSRIYLPKNLQVLPTVLVDGVVAGTWKVSRAKRAATLVVSPFAALSKKAKAEMTNEADKLVRFIESDAASFDVRVDKPS